MSGFFKKIDHCPNVAGSLLDDETEGESDYGLDLEALFSDKKTELMLDFSAAEVLVASSGDEEEGEAVPGLDDDVQELDEFTVMWTKMGLIPDRDQVNRVMENRRKIQAHIEELWLTLQQTINETFNKTGRICSEEIHQLKHEIALVSDMSNIMDQRLAFLAMRVEPGS